MAYCYYQGESNRGNQIWGSWICSSENIESNMVRFCRKAFEHRFKNMWIKPIFFEDTYFRYTEEFFKCVGVELYPKLTPIPKHLHNGENYEDIVWRISHDDISKSIADGVVPVMVLINGVRYKHNGDNYSEIITSINTVKDFGRYKSSKRFHYEV